jgi:hypothetical protein
MQNPYNPLFGRRPERFLGRDLIVYEILSSLNNENSPWRTTLIVGVRGSGKTALLSDIYESIRDDNVIVVPVSPEDEILDDILSHVYKKMPQTLLGNIAKKLKVSVGGNLSIELNRNNEAPSFTDSFRYQLTLMLDELRKKNFKVLFLVDETQKHSSGMRTFIATYQQLIRERYDVSLVMAGLPNVISDILNDNILTFLRRANQVTLNNVDLLTVKYDFRDSFLKHFSVSEELLDKAATYTEGYPYLIQLIGFYLWNNLANNENESAALEKALIQSKVNLFQNVHKLLYSELSPSDKEFVLAMVEDNKTSKFSDIIKRTNRSKNYISSYRIRLIDFGYIKSVGHGEIQFCLPYTREFLLQELDYEKM